MVKIYVPKGCEILKPALNEKIEQCLEERERLGLSVPKDFDVAATYYIEKGTSASATDWETPSINLNLSELARRTNSEVEKWIPFFERLSNLVKTSADCNRALANPELFFEYAELNETPETIEEVRKNYAKFGEDYDDFKREVIKKAKRANTLIKDSLPSIITYLKFKTLMEHEIDHLDLYSSVLNSRCLLLTSVTRGMEHWLSHKKKGKVESVLSYVNSDLVCSYNFHALTEVRAKWFQFVYDWKKPNHDEVKEKIAEDLRRNYASNWMESIVRKMLILERGGRDIDDDTLNHLNNIYFRRKFPVDEAKVDLDLVKKIQEGAQAHLQYCFFSAGVFLNVVHEAYRDDMNRLRRANEARTFIEYIDTCASTPIDQRAREYFENVDKVFVFK